MPTDTLTLVLPIKLTDAVGVRYGSAQVRNLAADQQRLLDAFDALPDSEGGSRDSKGSDTDLAPLLTNGRCHTGLAVTIAAFQKQHHLGSDGVADPQGALLRKLNELLGAPKPRPPKPAAPVLPPRGQRFKRPSAPPIAGQCTITNINNATITAGLVAGGFFAVQIQDARGRQVEYAGVGGGAAVGLDPSKLLKFLGNGGLAAYLGKLLAAPGAPASALVKWALEALQGVGLSAADWLALMGAKIPVPVGGTLGVVVSPLFDLVPMSEEKWQTLVRLLLGRLEDRRARELIAYIEPTLRLARVPQFRPVTMEMLPGADAINKGSDGGWRGSFFVANAGAGAAVSAEIGVIAFSKLLFVPGEFEAVGLYGNFSVPILKLGAGLTAQQMVVVDSWKTSGSDHAPG